LLVADSFWEKSTAGWWLISRANRLLIPSALSLAAGKLLHLVFFLKESCGNPWPFLEALGLF
jgi:hypothetical protein